MRLAPASQSRGVNPLGPDSFHAHTHCSSTRHPRRRRSDYALVPTGPCGRPAVFSGVCTVVASRVICPRTVNGPRGAPHCHVNLLLQVQQKVAPSGTGGGGAPVAPSCFESRGGGHSQNAKRRHAGPRVSAPTETASRGCLTRLVRFSFHSRGVVRSASPLAAGQTRPTTITSSRIW